MLAEVDVFADWLAEGAAAEASWRGLGAAYQCGRELWGVPLTLEMHYADGFTSVMVCGVSRFGAWEVDDSYAVAEASDEFDAGAWAFVECVRQLMEHGGFCLTWAAARAKSEAGALDAGLAPASTRDEPRRL
jgi:hypothetical protein